MHQHNRSTKNHAANPSLVRLVREEFGRSPAELGLRPVSTFEDHDYNVGVVSDQLSRVSGLIIQATPKEDPWLTGPDAPLIRDQLWPPSNRINGMHPVTACEAQWVNDGYPATVDGLRKFTQFVKTQLVPEGCAGIETVAWRYDLLKLIGDDGYRDDIVGIHGNLPRVDVFSNHCIEQCVCDPIRRKHADLLPKEVFGTDNNPYAINFRAGVMSMLGPVCAKRLGTNDVVHGFCGGAGLWQVAYDFARGADDIAAGKRMLTGYWNPILDVYTHLRCVHGLEVHGTEAGFDADSFRLTREAFNNRPEWGLGFDKSHFIWQGMDPALVIADFAQLLYHFHFKSVRFDLTGQTGRMRGLQPLNELLGGWQFHTIGNGHDFRGNPENLEEDFMAVNATGYNGNVSCENEQPGANPENRMIAAIRNVIAAQYVPGRVILPDAAKK